MTLDDQIAEAERDVLIAALRMCNQAMKDYLTMAESEAVCRRQFLKSRECAEIALRPYAGRKIGPLDDGSKG